MKQKHGREMEIGKEEERGKEGRERKVESFRPPPPLSLFPLPRRNPHHAAESPSFAPRPPRSRGNDACASVRSGIATSSEMPLNANGIGFCFLPVSFFSKKTKKKRRRSTVYVAFGRVCVLSPSHFLLTHLDLKKKLKSAHPRGQSTSRRRICFKRKRKNEKIVRESHFFCFVGNAGGAKRKSCPPRAQRPRLGVPPAPEHKLAVRPQERRNGAAGKGPIRQLPDYAAEFLVVLGLKFFSFFLTFLSFSFDLFFSFFFSEDEFRR